MKKGPEQLSGPPNSIGTGGYGLGDLVVRVLTLTISRRAQSCRQTLVQGSPCARAPLRRVAIPC